ncbi:MAG: glycosyltransferase [Treponema sp.]|nr:glycosyltransferase [Treponema sp.]
MNVAFFVDAYYPTVTGVITVVAQLKMEMEKNGHKVLIFTVESRKKDRREEKEPGIYRVPTNSFILPTLKGVYNGRPNVRKIAKILKENDIQICHSHTEFPLGRACYKSAKLAGIPCVATTHTMWEDYFRYYLGFIPKHFTRMWLHNFFNHFNALINVSQKAYDYFHLPHMLPKKPARIIPNAIDETKFCNADYSDEEKRELRKSLGLGEGDKLILYTGRIVEEKRLEELYEIVSDIVRKKQNVKACFVGTGIKKDHLKRRLARENLEDKIIFTGFVTWPDIAKYYSIADVFVTASLSEMHSMTVLEAITMSNPIVCRRDTSFTDTIFHGENGFLADTDQEMEEYIVKLLDDDEMRLQMRKKAFEISQRFSLENQAKRHIEYYTEIIEGKI